MLVHLFYPNNLGNLEGSEEIIRRELQSMGPISKPGKKSVGHISGNRLMLDFSTAHQQITGGSHTEHNTIVGMVGGTLMFFSHWT